MTPEPTLIAKIIDLDTALDDAGIAHAFGGAIALAYCAEPRATGDIDVNVAVGPSALAEFLDSLPVGVDRQGADPVRVEHDGQMRLWWGTIPIDVFFTYHEFHSQLFSNVRRVPFADTDIPVIDGADLVVCKAMFGRPKDWADIEAIAQDGRVAFERATYWLGYLLGADSPQLDHLNAVLARPRLGVDPEPPEPPEPLEPPRRGRPGPGLGF